MGGVRPARLAHTKTALDPPAFLFFCPLVPQTRNRHLVPAAHDLAGNERLSARARAGAHGALQSLINAQLGLWQEASPPRRL